MTPWHPLRRWLAIAAVSTSALIAGTVPSGAAPAPTRVAAAAKATGFPKVTVTDIRTGKAFDLSSLAKEGKPVLAWFWAPY